MQKYETNLCPVCGGTIENGICSKCGYIRLLFPEVVPESIKLQEEVRISKCRMFIENNIQSRKSAQKEIEKHQREAESLKKTVNEQRLSIANAEEELQKFRDDNAALKTTRENTEAQLSICQSRLQDVKNLSETLSNQNRVLTIDLAKAKDEISQVKRCAKASNVYFILDDDGEFSVIPVSDNNRYFATGPGIESCRVPEDSITLLPVMTTCRVAFAVEKSLTGGYSLSDLAGTLTSSGATKGNKMRLTQGVSLKIAGGRFKLYFCINQQ